MAITCRLAFLIQYHYSFYIYMLIITLLLTAMLIVLAIRHYRELKKATGNGLQTFPANHLQLNALLNSLNDIIYEFNEDKVCLNVWYNEHTVRVIDPKEYIGKKISDIIGPQRAQKFHDALDYVIKHHKSTSVEYQSDFGTGKWYIAQFSPVFDRAGNYISIISASVTDISEQRRYADALKQNEQLLIEAQRITKTGNWWYDVKTQEIFWSASMYAILETDREPANMSKYEY